MTSVISQEVTTVFSAVYGRKSRYHCWLLENPISVLSTWWFCTLELQLLRRIHNRLGLLKVAVYCYVSILLKTHNCLPSTITRWYIIFECMQTASGFVNVFMLARGYNVSCRLIEPIWIRSCGICSSLPKWWTTLWNSCRLSCTVITLLQYWCPA